MNGSLFTEAAIKRISKELPLDESSVQTMQSKRAGPRVAFGALVENGYIKPGSKIFDKKRRWLATVRADGSISTGSQVGSIHSLGKDLQNAPSCNGWTFWHYECEGGEVKTIDNARQLYLLATED